MTAREVKKILKAAGWTFASGGAHQTKAVSPDGKIRIPIPEHGGKDIKLGTLKAIERQTGVVLRREEAKQ
jgi:predicted RNA binding protein YcfA (HicA-like mRNA interferase family)